MKSLKRTTVVGWVVIVVVIAAAVFGGVQTRTAVSEADELVVDAGSVEVGQVLDVATRDGDECVYNRAIEVSVDVSLAEPTAGITVGWNDDCELTVIEKRRTYANAGSSRPGGSLPTGSSTWRMGTRSSNTPPNSVTRYRAEAKSEWNDFLAIDVAATKVRYRYEENAARLTFLGSPSVQCIKMSHWRTEFCTLRRQYAGTSTIDAQGSGTFSVRPEGYFRHTQRPSFLARRGGSGTATCWRSLSAIPGLYFRCDGSLRVSG